jgi:hypothetical protein
MNLIVFHALAGERRYNEQWLDNIDERQRELESLFRSKQASKKPALASGKKKDSTSSSITYFSEDWAADRKLFTKKYPTRTTHDRGATLQKLIGEASEQLASARLDDPKMDATLRALIKSIEQAETFAREMLTDTARPGPGESEGNYKDPTDRLHQMVVDVRRRQTALAVLAGQATCPLQADNDSDGKAMIATVPGYATLARQSHISRLAAQLTVSCCATDTELLQMESSWIDNDAWTKIDGARRRILEANTEEERDGVVLEAMCGPAGIPLKKRFALLDRCIYDVNEEPFVPKDTEEVFREMARDEQQKLIDEEMPLFSDLLLPPFRQLIVQFIGDTSPNGGARYFADKDVPTTLTERRLLYVMIDRDARMKRALGVVLHFFLVKNCMMRSFRRFMADFRRLVEALKNKESALNKNINSKINTTGQNGEEQQIGSWLSRFVGSLPSQTVFRTFMVLFGILSLQWIRLLTNDMQSPATMLSLPTERVGNSSLLPAELHRQHMENQEKGYNYDTRRAHMRTREEQMRFLAMRKLNLLGSGPDAMTPEDAQAFGGDELVVLRGALASNNSAVRTRVVDAFGELMFDWTEGRSQETFVQTRAYRRSLPMQPQGRAEKESSAVSSWSRDRHARERNRAFSEKVVDAMTRDFQNNQGVAQGNLGWWESTLDFGRWLDPTGYLVPPRPPPPQNSTWNARDELVERLRFTLKKIADPGLGPLFEGEVKEAAGYIQRLLELVEKYFPQLTTRNPAGRVALVSPTLTMNVFSALYEDDWNAISTALAVFNETVRTRLARVSPYRVPGGGENDFPENRVRAERARLNALYENLDLAGRRSETMYTVITVLPQNNTELDSATSPIYAITDEAQAQRYLETLKPPASFWQAAYDVLFNLRMSAVCNVQGILATLILKSHFKWKVAISAAVATALRVIGSSIRWQVAQENRVAGRNNRRVANRFNAAMWASALAVDMWRYHEMAFDYGYINALVTQPQAARSFLEALDPNMFPTLNQATFLDAYNCLYARGQALLAASEMYRFAGQYLPFSISAEFGIGAQLGRLLSRTPLGALPAWMFGGLDEMISTDSNGRPDAGRSMRVTFLTLFRQSLFMHYFHTIIVNPRGLPVMTAGVIASAAGVSSWLSGAAPSAFLEVTMLMSAVPMIVESFESVSAGEILKSGLGTFVVWGLTWWVCQPSTWRRTANRLSQFWTTAPGGSRENWSAAERAHYDALIYDMDRPPMRPMPAAAVQPQPLPQAMSPAQQALQASRPAAVARRRSVGRR